jgi:hypothetical protein
VSERSCDTCAKRGEWVKQSGRGFPVMAECGHRPLPAFWGSRGPLLVAPGCGSQCQHWADRAKETKNG